ncbi:MAG: pyridoxine 5'-phosphate synthase [Bacteroidota bacterium]
MTHTRLSVNLNKIALIRNARGSNLPNLSKVAADCEAFGAEGITVHPRPDQRHVRYDDVPVLKQLVKTEFNVEGNPTATFLDLVCQYAPHQVTLVPDAPGALTSDAGWDTIRNEAYLKEVIQRLQAHGIRVSIFVDPVEKMLEGAKKVGTDRIELYTGPYAEQFAEDRVKAVAPYTQAGKLAGELELGLNAGHDLNLDNLAYFKAEVPNLLEVSIGHALTCDALYYGLQNTIGLYLNCLKTN